MTNILWIDLTYYFLCEQYVTIVTTYLIPGSKHQYHGHQRRDFITWIKPWMSISPATMDPSIKEHESELGFGRLVMLFRCYRGFDVDQGAPPVQRDLAFIEEVRPYKDPRREKDTLCEDFGCSRLYGTHPNKVYYVIDIAKIIGPAPITPDPVHPTIPYGAFDNMSQARRKRDHQDARTDSKKGKGDGSPLYIVNEWAFEWGM